jgi:hypothetical protein
VFNTINRKWIEYKERKLLMSHPLTDNQKWVFWQPYIAAKSTVMLLNSMKKADNEGELISPVAASTCREGVLSNMRQYLWDKTMQGEQDGYKKTFKRLRRVRLFDPRLHEDLQGANQIRMHVNGLKPKGDHNGAVPEGNVEEWLMLMDALVGLPSVLLSHRRPQGEWWRTDPAKCKATTDYISWNGTDNWFMRHPTLLAIITGLSRQAALYTAHGFTDEILSLVDRSEVEEALTSGDWKLAFGLCETLRPYIEVPNGSGGAFQNYPFPYGQWKRFDRLHRAQRRHNYEKVFEGNFYDCWGLIKSGVGGQWSGSFAYWGNPGKENDKFDLLMKLGEPRRRAKGVKDSKSAA